MQFFRSIIRVFSRKNKFFSKLALFFIVLISTLVFLCTTTLGLSITIKTVSYFLPGNLVVTELEGHLINQFSFKTLAYENPDFKIIGHQLTIHWRLQDLIFKQLLIKKLIAEELTITRKKTASNASSKIKLSFPSLPINLILEKAEINALNLMLGNHEESIKSLKFSAQFTSSQWEITTFNFILRDHQFKFIAYINPHFPYSLHLVSQVHPLFLPLLEGNISVTGNFYQYHWKGQFKHPFLGHIEGSTQGKTVVNVMKWDKFSWPLKDNKSLLIDKGKLLVNGTWQNLFIDLTSKFRAPISGELQTKAHIQPNKSQITTQFITNVGDLNLSAQYDPNLFPHAQGQLFYKLQKNSFVLQELNNLTLKGEFTANNPQDLAINTQIEANYLKNPLIATVGYSKQKIKGQLDLGSNQVRLELHLPELNLLAMDIEQTMNGFMVLNVNSLSFLKNLNPLISQIEGQLQAKLSIQGSVKQPKLFGDVNLNHGELALSKFGIDLKPIELSLHSQNQKWQTKGSIKSKEKELLLSGEGEFSPEVKGQIKLNGQNFPLINTSEYNINVTPALTFQFSPALLKLQGAILIPEALIKPQTFTSSVTLSEDAVFIDEKKQADNLLNIDTDIQITMGDKVKLAIEGLQGELVGGLHLRQIANTSLIAEGELNVKNGQYKAYGQNLTIEQGQLVFTGGAISNPGIQVKAVRQFNNTNTAFSGSNRLFDFNPSNLQTLDFGNKTTVGIEISGRINTPKVQLFSTTPTLSQADILSMLILGKPASQANKSGGQLLLTAISALNLDSGSNGLRLLNQVKETLGLDINLQNNSQFNQKTNESTDSAALVLGKSLSKRLYLSYNVNFTQSDSNVLTLKYLLNKFFSLQVSASTSGSGIDLLYTRQKG